MKPGVVRGLRRLLANRGSLSRRSDRAEGFRPGASADFDPVEFAEFVNADDGPVPIDPVFKARLRARLWSRLQQRENGNRKTPIASD